MSAAAARPAPPSLRQQCSATCGVIGAISSTWRLSEASSTARRGARPRVSELST
jgi:hypothetical protein